jgi:hypothetical protein
MSQHLTPAILRRSLGKITHGDIIGHTDSETGLPMTLTDGTEIADDRDLDLLRRVVREMGDEGSLAIEVDSDGDVSVRDDA